MFPRWTIDAKKEKDTILTTYEFEEASIFKYFIV